MKKKTLSKVVAGALVGIMSMSMLAGCGGSDSSSTSSANSGGSSTSASTSAGSSTSASNSSGGDSAAAGDITIAMLPKFKGENYFDACRGGAEEAAEELGIELLYDGPSQDQATNQKQVDILEGWIAQGVDAIVVSPNDPTAIAPTLQKAQDAGIKVLTFDADAQADSRDLFVNQISADAAAKGLLDAAATDLKEKGYGPDKPANIALVSSTGTDANQNAWTEAIKGLLETDEYSFMVIQNEDTDIYYPGTDETQVNSEAATLIGRMSEGEDQIQCAIALSSMATPALGAQYQSASSKPDASKITLTGLATPNALKTYIKDESNPLNIGVLWNCADLGYLAIQSAYQMVTGDITSDSTSINAGRLGEKAIENKECILGDALVFDASNVDEFDY